MNQWVVHSFHWIRSDLVGVKLAGCGCTVVYAHTHVVAVTITYVRLAPFAIVVHTHSTTIRPTIVYSARPRPSDCVRRLFVLMWSRKSPLSTRSLLISLPDDSFPVDYSCFYFPFSETDLLTLPGHGFKPSLYTQIFLTVWNLRCDVVRVGKGGRLLRLIRNSLWWQLVERLDPPSGHCALTDFPIPQRR